MKFGFCLDWKNEEHLRAAKAAGADFVEFAFRSFDNATEEEIARLAGLLRELELPVLSYNGFFWVEPKLTGPGRDWEAALAFVEPILKKLEHLGAKHVVFGSSDARRRQDGEPLERTMEEVTTFLRDHLAPLLGKYGWTASIEPLSECNYIRTTADGLALARAVNRPEIRVLADFYHVGVIGEPAHSVVALGDTLRHVHIASTAGRTYPTPADPDDYVAIFRDLAAAGYDGAISVEAPPSEGPLEPQARLALETLRAAAGAAKKN